VLNQPPIQIQYLGDLPAALVRRDVRFLALVSFLRRAEHFAFGTEADVNHKGDWPGRSKMTRSESRD
jgi:hypothetical protein